MKGMFFSNTKRIRELEGEVEILTEEVKHLNDEARRNIITLETLENRIKTLESLGVVQIARYKELKEKVEELSKKKISDTTLEDEDSPSPAQILDEYLNGVDEE
jgi:polyhydroxyalkanoate synthesis regulator phasin